MYVFLAGSTLSMWKFVRYNQDITVKDTNMGGITKTVIHFAPKLKK